MKRTEAFVALTRCKCWKEAEARLREGASARAVAEFIQSAGELDDMKVDSLKRQLVRYRQRVLKVKALSALYIDREIGKLGNAIDDVEELTRLILTMKKRISKDLELEERMPKSMSSLSRDIQQMYDMIERRARLLQDLGMMPRAPERHEHFMVGDQTWAKILEKFPTPEQRQQAREMIQADFAAGHVKEVVEAAKDEPFRIEAPKPGEHEEDEE